MVQLSRYRYQHISTHDLTRRSTFRSLKMLYHHLYFNSRPHKEVDLLRQYKQTTHTYFNSRPHKEVDVLQAACTERCNHFNSRPHKEVDLIPAAISQHSVIFQLTTSQGGRLHDPGNDQRHRNFNSRPHKEVDSNFYTKSFPFKITFCAHCI